MDDMRGDGPSLLARLQDGYPEWQAPPFSQLIRRARRRHVVRRGSFVAAALGAAGVVTVAVNGAPDFIGSQSNRDAQLTSSASPTAESSPAAGISRTEAEGIALADHARGTPEFSAYFATRAEADAEFQVGGSTPGPVWLVTVMAPVMTEGGPGAPPVTRAAYSVVIDARSGSVTDTCGGCTWLHEDR